MDAKHPGGALEGGRGPVTRYLSEDHARLDALLLRATAASGAIDAASYAEFRVGLLRHIGLEEKILLPAAARARGGQALASAAKLRLDHGALAALLVPTPTAAIVAAIRRILTDHNAVEEEPGGVYDTCERLAGEDAADLLARLRASPNVRVQPHVDSERVMDATRRALARAGYVLDEEG